MRWDLNQGWNKRVAAVQVALTTWMGAVSSALLAPLYSNPPVRSAFWGGLGALAVALLFQVWLWALRSRQRRRSRS